MSEEEEKKVVDALSNLTYQETDEKYLELLQTGANTTLHDRKHTNRDVVAPSRRWRGRFEKKHDIIGANALVTTDARAVACADVRNAVSFAAMNQMVLQDYHIKPELLLNVDGTAFTVGKGSGRKERLRFVRGKKPKNMPVKVRLQSNKPNRLPYTQKAHMLISAGGFQAAPIYIVPDCKMPDFDAVNIRNLADNLQVGKKGKILKGRVKKDNLVISRRRAVLLLHPKIAKKEEARVTTRNNKLQAQAAKRAAKSQQRR